MNPPPKLVPEETIRAQAADAAAKQTMHRVSWWYFIAAILAALLLVLPSILVKWRDLSAPLPVVVHNQRVHWVGPRTLELTSDGADWTDSCPIVTISRFLLLKSGPLVPVPAAIISGPLKGLLADPRFDLHDIVPQRRPPSVMRIEVPGWIKDPAEVQYYQSTIRVPDDRPCASGRTWNQTLAQLTVPDPPTSAMEGRPQ
jgi:hypothetical protein